MCNVYVRCGANQSTETQTDYDLSEPIPQWCDDIDFIQDTRRLITIAVYNDSIESHFFVLSMNNTHHTLETGK